LRSKPRFWSAAMWWFLQTSQVFWDGPAYCTPSQNYIRDALYLPQIFLTNSQKTWDLLQISVLLKQGLTRFPLPLPLISFHLELFILALPCRWAVMFILLFNSILSYYYLQFCLLFLHPIYIYAPFLLPCVSVLSCLNIRSCLLESTSCWRYKTIHAIPCCLWTSGSGGFL